MLTQNLAKDWWKEEVVYQIYPQSFKDSNHDGIGDLNGIREKLPYLKDLGITCLWISPIFTSPLADNGYDIADYEGINPIFGSMEDLEALIQEAEALDIKIILDLVVNHSSDEHPWFQKALKDPKSPYRDYYIFKQGHDGKAPNNWRSLFGGSAWEAVDGEDNTYYLHTFHKKQPDLNWENPDLRQEIYSMINRWLDKGIAGFRIDSITFVKKDQDYQSLPADGADNLSNIKHKTRNRPGIAEFLQELNQETFQRYNVMTVGEAPGVPYEEFDQYIGPKGYFNMIFDFSYADIDVENGSEWFRQSQWTYDDYIEAVKRSQYAMQKAGWAANFIENHDQPRALSKLIKDPNYQNEIGATALASSYFFLRGTPFIYQGQELGIKNVTWTDIDTYNDISSHDNYKRALLEGYSDEKAITFVQKRSRDNGRTPFPWDASQYGGFSDHEPWLAMTEEYPTINAKDNPVHDFYQKLIELRQDSNLSQVLIYGDINFLDNLPSQVMGYQRQVEEQEVIVLVNFNSEAVALDDSFESYEVILSNYSQFDKLDNNYIELAPMQAIVMQKGGTHHDK
ncbi:alpha-glucosidase [Aerococcus urinae]|uniref:glycoside hydrolase family 13 protein n=1 Tax=Aerococcus TaxID=1375 RepID=UPI000DCCDA23|nr:MULTISPECIES: alpha-glucosidase [Aerococcus]MCY3034537.1 alpha-glucosidase [Aerococcus mictus]MCY3063491.1 alpha-glucosidase [Aerococcus mictus]MCY3072894.1 alpha-glucosidase [Aerococcus mictus]MDK7195235.1 alpha-glucosidase [Aerococcus urinae]MDK7716365.1 alpha-glucosidase [Aerococcus urinae]